MPKNELHIPGWYTQVLKKSGCGMPNVVQLNHSNATALADQPEGANKVAWFDRPAVGSGEDKLIGRAHVGPVRIGRSARRVLPLVMSLERRTDRLQKRQVPPSSSGLHLACEEHPADSLQLLADVNLTCVKVNVLPSKSQGLASPQPTKQKQ